jgi:hypothetical protein
VTRLIVKKAKSGEEYRDIARINSPGRVDFKGRPIPSGTVCYLRNVDTKRDTYVWVRGVGDDLLKERSLSKDESYIMIDDATRERLGVNLDSEKEFLIKKANLLEQILFWPWKVSDPGLRISFIMGLMGLATGLFGMLFPLFDSKDHGNIFASSIQLLTLIVISLVAACSIINWIAIWRFSCSSKDRERCHSQQDFRP